MTQPDVIHLVKIHWMLDNKACDCVTCSEKTDKSCCRLLLETEHLKNATKVLYKVQEIREI